MHEERWWGAWSGGKEACCSRCKGGRKATRCRKTHVHEEGDGVVALGEILLGLVLRQGGEKVRRGAGS